jgi:hypothetical protein
MKTDIESYLDRYVEEMGDTEAQVHDIVTEETAALAAEVRPSHLIRFWSGGMSSSELSTHALYTGSRIFELMNDEMASRLDIEPLTIQGLNRLRVGYGEVHSRLTDRYYAVEDRILSGAYLEKAKLEVVTARMGKKATAAALTYYQHGAPLAVAA